MSNINFTSTFSMQNILNQPIDPILCKRILEQIKSPLMQQSFVLTNDQSFNQSYINIPKRPNIPPLEKIIYYAQKPINKNNQIKYGYSQNNEMNNQNNQQPSIFLQNRSSYFSYQNKQQVNSYMEAILSPLDPNINKRKKEQNQSLGFFQSLARKLCGAVENKQQQYQYVQEKVNIDIHNKDNNNMQYFQRKKIFDINQKKQIRRQKAPHSILFDQLKKEYKSHIQLKVEYIKKLTIAQILDKLRINEHYQVKQFIELCLFIMQQLYKVSCQIQYCQRNISLIFNYAVFQENSIKGVINNSKYSQKALKRLNYKSIPNLLQKFILNDYMKTNNLDFKQVHKQSNKLSESIQKINLYFENIQQKIDNFNQRKDKIEILKKIYQLLTERFTNYTTKSNIFIYYHIKNIGTYHQLVNLFNDIYLTNHQQRILSLQYIWPTFQTNILTQQQFIKCVLRMNSIYQQNNGQISQSKKRFQKSLEKMGYIKN